MIFRDILVIYSAQFHQISLFCKHFESSKLFVSYQHLLYLQLLKRRTKNLGRITWNQTPSSIIPPLPFPILYVFSINHAGDGGGGVNAARGLISLDIARIWPNMNLFHSLIFLFVEVPRETSCSKERNIVKLNSTGNRC